MSNATQKASKPAAAKSGAATSNGKDPFADYTERSESRVDPAGYWDPAAGPLHGVLGTAFEYVQKSGKSRGKPRVVYIFKLLSPTVATVDKGKDTATLEAGEICAVFDSQDLRDKLRDLQGCAILLERAPQKKVLANTNEMWVYHCRYKGKGKPLVIRKHSEPDRAGAPDADDVNDADENPDNWADQF